MRITLTIIICTQSSQFRCNRKCILLFHFASLFVFLFFFSFVFAFKMVNLLLFCFEITIGHTEMETMPILRYINWMCFSCFVQFFFLSRGKWKIACNENVKKSQRQSAHCSLHCVHCTGRRLKNWIETCWR